MVKTSKESKDLNAKSTISTINAKKNCQKNQKIGKDQFFVVIYNIIK